MAPAGPDLARSPFPAQHHLGPRLAHRPVGLASVFSTILLAEAIEAHVPAGSAVVVDVGGGEAPYARAARGAIHVAVDWRSPELTLATHQVVGDASRLPIGSGVADLVLCTEVVEHVADDRALYAELRRVVSDDGLLVLSAPFVHALHESPHDHRRPTSAGLVHGLTTAGFDVASVHAVGDTGAVVTDIRIRARAAQVRAVGRRAPSAVERRLERAFARRQERLADRALARTAGAAGGIDPLVPVPALCLGYVVVARPGHRPSHAET